ncbi:hypothetical protein LTR66_011355, partial [Elasticomyces elasticus]
MRAYWIVHLALSACFTEAWKYDPNEVKYNLNSNQHSAEPLEYYASYPNHTYQPSPANWRFPFYSFFVDRYVNGDPTNDNANGTAWEHDIHGTQLRHGGDLKGLLDSLDYLHGMGIRGIYIAGSLLINFPWSADSYSPLDHTLLDRHFGTIETWREVINEIHNRGMYIILDNTMSTMSDLVAFQGYLNSSTPWRFNEHNALWKGDREYADWKFGNDWEEACSYPYPRFWDQGGHYINDNFTQAMVGCRDSEFNQYGDVGAFGNYPEWQKQLSKFNSVQDRLREWRPSVLSKLEHFSCMIMQALDIDGFRIDKAMQVTVDAQGSWSGAMRLCAKALGKNNFFIPGEIVNGNANAAIYLGRGKEPSMKNDNLTDAITNPNHTYIRENGKQALDGGAFHYSTYRAMMRFLGLDGDLLAANDTPINFVDEWDVIVQTNDLVNANTGVWDPRHLYGVSNQDVVRWPGLINGTHRQILGTYIIEMLMPGVPMISWGEEQAFYVLDNTATNYVYGRQAMSSSLAWQMHGCHVVGDENLSTYPVNSSRYGCQDEGVKQDHRDPTHPVYNAYKGFHELRSKYPVLNDGYSLITLSNQTSFYLLEGSYGQHTEHGLWSVLRQAWPGVQDLSGEGFGNQPVHLLYTNENYTKTFESDCSSRQLSIVSPFDQGTTVKNLFYPYEEVVLEASPFKLGLNGSTKHNGCVPSFEMPMYGFKAFVPVDAWSSPSPKLTKVLINGVPGHDQRFLASSPVSEQETMEVEIRFSDLMDCDSVRRSLSVTSTTENGTTARFDNNSISCLTTEVEDMPFFYGSVPSKWRARLNLTGVSDGIHVININNATNQGKNVSTGSVEHIMFRIGQPNNPMVFPMSANYSSELFFKTEVAKRDDKTTGSGFYVVHNAAGADMFRYSLTWGSTWSDWEAYTGGNTTLAAQSWNGTSLQSWNGDHVKVQYWGRSAGSSDHLVEGDLFGSKGPARRFPHFFIHGPFNQYGYDSGIKNQMSQYQNGTWHYVFMTEWPAQFQLNVWGMDESGAPDISYALGDVDNDTVLDRIAPDSLQMSVVNITDLGPGSPYLAYEILFNDGDFRYYLRPVGSRWKQLALFILLAVIPPMTAVLGVYVYRRAFYQVKFNQIGLGGAKSVLPTFITEKFNHRFHNISEKSFSNSSNVSISQEHEIQGSVLMDGMSSIGAGVRAGATIEPRRRTVLIATMEYNIEDWNLKVKIGGLGVMAQLMGKNLEHQDLIWVVPCAGDLEYPIDTPAQPIDVTILGKIYEVQCQTHRLRNITYVLLDAPVFRRQTTTEPYPPRMDDLDSAIYYSAWNQCIAEAMRRYPIDLYHINDYHGTVAPLYLLPETIPCCLSLHNAEFQGLWPMRTPKESLEICSVFNLEQAVVHRYVQFGEVFNLLHAGASILRIHQKGFGAVGVSKKYGKRSYARYPIFWGLDKIGALPNPDPSDTAEWDKKLTDPSSIEINQEFEDGRAELKRKAQEWAGLEQRADADLFVFVGRWSMQKGIDLIADVFPAVLEQYPHTQLICIGPQIDLYGKFAALKLDAMMKKYPGRVYSKPEFTALPPFIFSGAEFALIPSRDEPFGLVAVEFGRKGALGVGSRVGGLGQMPGWWYTIESTTTKHNMQQFKMAIHGALKSDYQTRATMRARSAKQRFPVAQWKEDLEILQSSAIKIHKRRIEKLQAKTGPRSGSVTPSTNGWQTPIPGWMTPRSGWGTPRGATTPAHSRPGSRAGTRPSSPNRDSESSATLSGSSLASFSLGFRSGPGHAMHHQRNSPPTPGPSVSRRNSLEIIENRRHLVRTEDEVTISHETAEASKRQSQFEGLYPDALQLRDGARMPEPPVNSAHTFSPIAEPQIFSTSANAEAGFPFLHIPHTPIRASFGHGEEKPLSLEHVLKEKEDKKPQELMPFFTDPTGMYYKTFERKLENLSGKTSESALCIEEYLERSEKQWFNRLHEAKMSRANTPTASRMATPAGSIFNESVDEEPMSQFLLPDNYSAPTGIRRLMNTKIGDWPLYAFLLALGQILAANSYQITLLTGQVGQNASKLYTIASIYLAASLFWWILFRRFACLYTLTLPWAMYGLAFFLLGVAPYATTTSGRGWVQNVATAFYGIASAS